MEFFTLTCWPYTTTTLKFNCSKLIHFNNSKKCISKTTNGWYYEPYICSSNLLSPRPSNRLGLDLSDYLSSTLTRQSFNMVGSLSWVNSILSSHWWPILYAAETNTTLSDGKAKNDFKVQLQRVSLYLLPPF